MYGETGSLDFCRALTIFKRELNNHDFFVFDLNLQKAPFNPCYYGKDYSISDCDEKLKYEDVDPKFVSEGKASRYLAGLEFYNITEKDNRPKIFFSAATQSREIRKFVQLFSKRLEDTFVIDAEHGRYTDIFDHQTNSVFKAIDQRFRSRQVEILIRQNNFLIQQLSTLLESWSSKYIPCADDLIIPHDGNLNSSKDKFWSLRTLFPKQVNQIQLDINIPDNLLHIRSCIRNYNFPDIYFWLTYAHGNVHLYLLKDLPAAIIRNRLDILREIDFSEIESSKITGYKRFSDILEIDKFNKIDVNDINEVQNRSFQELICNDLRKKITSEFTNFKINYNEEGSDTVKFNFSEAIVRSIGQFGVYIGDISYMYIIADYNKKYSKSDSIETLINVTGSTTNKTRELTIKYLFINSQHVNSLDIENVKIKLEHYFVSRFLDKFQLIDQGLGDLFEIICKRYRAIGIIQIGNQSIKLEPNSNIVNENNYEISYTFNFKYTTR